MSNLSQSDWIEGGVESSCVVIFVFLISIDFCMSFQFECQLMVTMFSSRCLLLPLSGPGCTLKNGGALSLGTKFTT
jgi:hypothetical protein